MQGELQFTDIADRRIAYRVRDGAGPTVLFLPGYGSDMEGTKALAIDAFAQRCGLSLIRFDYSGTGSSGGRFEDGTLDRWLDETVEIVDRLTNGPLIVVGSSMGGWLALHLAMRRLERVQAFVGIAAAPDFTQWGFTAEQADQLGTTGRMTRGFWESGQRMLILERPIVLNCPVRLIHGDQDTEVPLKVALRTLAAIRSADVQLTVVKGGGHRLSKPHEIETILRTIANLLEPNP